MKNVMYAWTDGEEKHGRVCPLHCLGFCREFSWLLSHGVFQVWTSRCSSLKFIFLLQDNLPDHIRDERPDLFNRNFRPPSIRHFSIHIYQVLPEVPVRLLPKGFWKTVWDLNEKYNHPKNKIPHHSLQTRETAGQFFRYWILKPPCLAPTIIPRSKSMRSHFFPILTFGVKSSWTSWPHIYIF